MAQSGWYADPVGRHEKRFYNGLIWTSDVLDGEEHGVDPVDADPVDASTPVGQAARSVAVAPAATVSPNGWRSPSPQAWRDGEDLVMRAGAPLPPICVFCGRPAVAGIRTAINARGHAIANLQILGLRIPVCEDDRARIRFAMWIANLSVVVSLAMMFVTVRWGGHFPGPFHSLTTSGYGMRSPLPTMHALIVGLLTYVAIYFVRRIVRGSSGTPRHVRLRVVRSQGGFVWLRNADERYLSQLPAVAPSR